MYKNPTILLTLLQLTIIHWRRKIFQKHCVWTTGNKEIEIKNWKLLSKVRFLKIQFFITRKRGSSGLCWDQKSIQNYWFMGGCFSTKFRGICRGTRYRNFIVVPTAVGTVNTQNDMGIVLWPEIETNNFCALTTLPYFFV